MTQWNNEIAVGIAAVRQAGIVCQAIQASMVPHQAVAKEDKSPVTAADFASQAVVCSHLAKAFPHDPVVGEEAAGVLRSDEKKDLRQLIVQQVAAATGQSCTPDNVLGWIDRGGAAGGGRGRYWTLDPIDGTKGFLRRGQYAIALALIDQGQIVLGILGCPQLPDGQGNTGVLLVAPNDGPVCRLSMQTMADTTGQAVRVSSLTDVTQASMCESVESGHSDQDAAALIVRDLGLTQPGLRMDSQAKYAAVACGDAEIYLRLPRNQTYREKIWDHAAGAIAVQQAGGRVTDIHGKDLDFSLGRELSTNLGVIATNGPIHDQVLAAVQKHCKV